MPYDNGPSDPLATSDADGGERTPAYVPETHVKYDSVLAAGAPQVGSSRYRPVGFHARGGLGEVHVAEDSELGRRVALKGIRDQFADDAASRGRFVREAEITGRLEHPGIVPVYGLVYGPGGRPVYAMRFIEGETLRDAVQRFHAAPQFD